MNMLFTVRYQAGPYSGTRQVHAEDGEDAKNKVRAQIRREMTLPMYSDSYKVVNAPRAGEEEDDA